MAFWYKTSKLLEISSFIEPDYDSLGTLGQWIPSFRAKLLRALQACHAAGEFTEVSADDVLRMLPKIPRDVELLYKLVLPLGTSYQVLEEDKTFAETRASMHLESSNPPFEVIEAFDSSEEMFNKLSEATKSWFLLNPSSESKDFRIRVTESLVSWMYYMENVSEKQQQVEVFQHKKRQAEAAKKDEPAWKKKQGLNWPSG